jgi:hypothetical protein
VNCESSSGSSQQHQDVQCSLTPAAGQSYSSQTPPQLLKGYTSEDAYLTNTQEAWKDIENAVEWVPQEKRGMESGKWRKRGR